MRRPFKIAVIILALLVLTPLALLAWIMWGQSYYYHLTFGPTAAEKIMARFGVTGAEVAEVRHHSGHPVFWMDGAEKFVVKLTAPLQIPGGNGPVSETEWYWKTKGYWVAAPSALLWAREGIKLAVACAENPTMGTDVLTLPQTAQTHYSFMNVPKPEQGGNIEALIYNDQTRELMYVYCNF